MARGVALKAARAIAPRSAPSPSHPLHVYSGRRLVHGSSSRSQEALGTAAKLQDPDSIPVQNARDVVTISDIKERSKQYSPLTRPHLNCTF